MSKGDVGVGGFKGEAGPKGEPVRFRSNSQTDADCIINPDLPLTLLVPCVDFLGSAWFPGSDRTSR